MRSPQPIADGIEQENETDPYEAEEIGRGGHRRIDETTGTDHHAGVENAAADYSWRQAKPLEQSECLHEVRRLEDYQDNRGPRNAEANYFGKRLGGVVDVVPVLYLEVIELEYEPEPQPER